LFEEAVKKFKAATDDLEDSDKIQQAADDLGKVNALMELPKIKDDEISRCTPLLFEGLKALFGNIDDKTDDRIWHPIIEDLNKLLKRLPEKEAELCNSDFADKMFAAVLDDQQIINDPKNEDIFDDL